MRAQLERGSSTANCPTCSYSLAKDALVCPLCGTLAGRAQPQRTAPQQGPISPVVRPRARDPHIGGFPPALVYLLVGAVLAPIFTLTPVLQYMGWFLGSLTHEMGHCIAAWFSGCPAYPAIRLDGHAAAMHQEQQIVVVAVLWLGMAYAGWSLRAHRGWLIACGLGLVLQPLLAFTWLGELLHLAAGHLGELAFATICFARVLDGGFTKSGAERAAYALLGWYLVGRNVWLHAGLVLSSARREWYEGSGSFGLTNDLIRIAQDLLGCHIEPVALVMTCCCALPLPLAWVIWRVRGETPRGGEDLWS